MAVTDAWARPAEFRLFIDGEWTEGAGDDALIVINPATEEVIGTGPQATSDDVDQAVAAARRAFDEGPWPRMKPIERSRILAEFAAALRGRAGELVELVMREAGSVQWLAQAIQVGAPIEHVQWWADRTATFSYEEPLPPTLGIGIGQGVIVKEPVGVVAAITPFNFPFFLNLWKVAPAIAMGNTVVLKPSPYTPLEAFVVAEILEEIGLPPGVVNVVTGDVAAGERLTTHPGVDMVSFTGSDAVGRKVGAQASGHLKRLILELGGKSALIIFPGANLDEVAPAALAFTTHCGQGCALTTRIIVHESIRDELVEKMVAALSMMTVGDPADPTVMIGPLIGEPQRERVERYIALGREEGADVVYGGGRPAGLDRGFFVEPTLFVGRNDLTIAQDEIFGPVGLVIPCRDEDDAVAIANDSRYGLSGAILHPDAAKAYDMARRIRTGTITINGGGGAFPATGISGGFKHSGVGRELGDYGLHEYLELKQISWGAGKL